MWKRRRSNMETRFFSGNVAAAEGAILAGCRFFGGYPITPSTEIAERMAFRLPQVGGVFIQMEDELASMAAILGASWGGVKAMTATSGPGLSLMQENIGLGAMTETPCVVVDVQRGGPSTGMPTLVAQADVMQARWGSHGDYEIIALAPSSVQECFDLTIRAFNLSEKYRTPVIVLMDESVGHMSEKVVIPSAEEIALIERKKPTVPPEAYRAYEPDEDLVPPMACAGEGYNVHVTGLTHDEKGYPVATDPEVQARLVRRLCDKILVHEPELRDIEEFEMDDADVAVISYGISARPSKAAVKEARKRGHKVGFIQLRTIWPFPEAYFQEIAERVKTFIVVEINYGQLKLEVDRVVGRERVHLLPKLGGDIHRPEDVYRKIREVYHGA
ncbi:MAG TPA: 2-oxoacid:acceptor oxidoreductase subunit alpha [Thermoplasmatales archaeon]|nr:MAG: 2-oxoacid:acceptor oxidoreductase subunit alpha [Thermoplasmata archaeon]HDN50266.1 2-oxoacid:acceptor oxidoreductase subunit alpha [Thermoplasmatales archaeon]